MHSRALALTLVALLVAAPAHGLERPSEPSAVTTGRGALLMGSQIVALAAGGVFSVALGSVWIEDHFRIHGRPDPRIITANIALALAVNMALAWLLLPDLARVTNDAGGTVDVPFVRGETLRRTRWIALAGAIFVGVLFAGSVVEKNEFGKGQAVMAVGAAGAALSVLTFDLTALLTVRSATHTSRQAPR